MSDIEIEIDDRKLTAKPNQMLIEVADAAGIYIPRFCYHKHLSIAANCRMCLVEVDKSPKALPACATPVAPGMKVFTKSAKTIEAQRAVMEFLLINHPLDCPVCDQGGECELQDISMGYGSTHSHYDECKRAVADENLGPLIETEMTRCILCTRCVRFGDEIAGIRELGVTNRGQHAEISTYVEKAVTSEVSGNMIDVCPVGALTSKPYRFTARAWELQQAPSISPHDCFGSHLNMHTRGGKVMRVVARENAAINDTWIADRDRFSYTGLYHADRISEPMARINGQWQTVSWQQALEIIASRLADVCKTDGAAQLGGLASPSATVEELYLLQKILRGLGSPHIDHRLREVDTRDQHNMPLFPGMRTPIAELEQCDAIILIGSNLQKEQPLAAIRVRKAIKDQAAVVLAINPLDYAFNFAVTAKHISAPQHMPTVLTEIVAALTNKTAHPFTQHLQGKQRICLILGALTQNHPQAAHIRYLAQQIATLTGGQLNIMTSGANAAGAWLAGAVPHREAGGIAAQNVGMNAYEMLKNPRQAYLLLNVEPDLDCANAAMACAALKQAKFVAALAMYRNPVLEAQADVILPMAAFTETAGTVVNAMGTWQSVTGVTNAYGAARPAWKILRVLGNFLHLAGFDYNDVQDVRREVHDLCEKAPSMTTTFAPITGNEALPLLTRIGEIPLYALDSLVRRALPLQAVQSLMEGELAAVRMHPEMALKLKVTVGANVLVKQALAEIVLPVVADTRVPLDAVWIAGGTMTSACLGDLFGSVEIHKV